MSFNSLSVNQNRAVNNLSKYVIGAEINRQEEPSGIATGVALMGGISGATWLFSNRKNIKGGFQQLVANAKEQKNIVNSAKKYAPGARFSTLRNKWAGAVEYTSKGELEALSKKLVKKPEYAGIKKYIDSALKSGSGYSEALKSAEKMQAIEKLNLYNSKVASQMASGSKLRALKNATGITKVSKSMKELAAKSGKFRSLAKGIKGNAGFALISLGIGLVSDVIPAFQLGADKGFKQLGKTVVKTGAEVAGWAAGAALGAKAGAVIGTCIGGPIGTVVGGAIGLVGGFLGSFLASKVADKVVGPSEVELAEQEAAAQVAKNARANLENLDELAMASYEQLLEHAKAGQLTEDDMIAKKSLEELIGQEIDLEAELKAQEQVEQESQGAAGQSSGAAQQPAEVSTPPAAAESGSSQTTPEVQQPVSQTYYPQTSFMPSYTGTTPYLPPGLNPYMSTGSMYSSPYSNDMFFQQMFGGYNYNPYMMQNQGNYFRYTG